MKLTTFLLFLFLANFHSNAQRLNGVDIRDIKSEYAFVEVNYRVPGAGVGLHIDMGHSIKDFYSNENELKGEDGKLFKFNSIVDGLNFMAKLGYEVIDLENISNEGKARTRNLMKAKK